MTKKIRWRMADTYPTRDEAMDRVDWLEGRGEKAKAQYNVSLHPRPWMVMVEYDSEYGR